VEASVVLELAAKRKMSRFLDGTYHSFCNQEWPFPSHPPLFTSDFCVVVLYACDLLNAASLLLAPLAVLAHPLHLPTVFQPLRRRPHIG
jgi:hypothetical protein